MGMLTRLQDAHPGVAITAFDGHYARIGDDDMHVVSHLRVEAGGRSDTIRAVEAGRRKTPHAKAIEQRFGRLIAEFERKAA
jgi:hypothetical protein